MEIRLWARLSFEDSETTKAIDCDPRQVTNHAGLQLFFLKHTSSHIFHNSGLVFFFFNNAHHRLWHSELLWLFSHVSHAFLNSLKPNFWPHCFKQTTHPVTYDLQVAKTRSHVPCFHLTFLQVADTLDPLLVFETFLFSWILLSSKAAPWLPELFTIQSSHGIYNTPGFSPKPHSFPFSPKFLNSSSI